MSCSLKRNLLQPTPKSEFNFYGFSLKVLPLVQQNPLELFLLLIQTVHDYNYQIIATKNMY